MYVFNIYMTEFSTREHIVLPTHPLESNNKFSLIQKEIEDWFEKLIYLTITRLDLFL